MTKPIYEHVLTEYRKILQELFRLADRGQVLASVRQIKAEGNYFGYDILVRHSILLPKVFDVFSRIAKKVKEQLTLKEREELFRDIDRLIDEAIDVRGGVSTQVDSLRAVDLTTFIGLEQRQVNYYSVEILYGTDRNRVVEGGRIRYGTDRGGPEVGICSVSIPIRHGMGEIERPKWWRLEFKENPEKHVTVLKILRLDDHSFREQLRVRVGKSDDKDAFVFIHGYNVTFDEASQRTAQMAFDLGFKGAAVMYSWPSKGDVDGYFADEDNVRWTLPHLKEFLRCVIDKSGAKKIHLIAHSMGTRALTDAIRMLAQDLSEDRQGPVVSQVILAAPDIDTQVFKEDIVPKLTAAAERITLYASSEDEALKFSRSLRKDQAPRAGEGGDRILLVPGVDSIDVSAVPMDFTGHSYFAERVPLLNDLFLLMNHGLPPEKRNLKEKVVGAMKCWEMRG